MLSRCHVVMMMLLSRHAAGFDPVHLMLARGAAVQTEVHLHVFPHQACTGSVESIALKLAGTRKHFASAHGAAGPHVRGR
jgi:hypothetical protein